METKQNCEHKKWARTGLWDGVAKVDGSREGGPIVKCVGCRLEKNITYEELGQMEKDGKFEIKRAVNRPNWFKPFKK